MALPGLDQIYNAIEATWPAKALAERGPFMLRDGDGGGKRVSAATLEDAMTGLEEIGAIASLMPTPLFMVRDGQTAFAEQLDTLDYRIVDPTNLYAIRVDALTDQVIPRVTAFCIWEPLQIMRDIWAEGGIGEARLRVMARASGPKTGILGRIDDQPAATAFVACDGDIAMLHALEVKPQHRRKGLAGWVMRQAAFWARENGATTLSVLVTEANSGANALYTSLGMTRLGQYHYRIKDAS